MRRHILSLGGLLATVTIATAQTPASEWPQLHGPARNGAARGAIPAGASLALAWKKPLPVGRAGLAVAGDRLYTLGSEGERDILFAFDAASGDEAWRLELGETHADVTSNGPGSTPALAGDLVVTVSSRCRLQAIDRVTRRVVWTNDIGATYASRFVKRGGCGMAPLVAGTRVIVTTGAATSARLAAFDVATGTQLWEAADLPNSHSLAPGWLDAGRGQVLYHHSRPPGVSGITAIDVETGTTLWQFDGKDGQSDATPVTLGTNRVLVETWAHATLYDIAAKTPLWRTTAMVAGAAPAIAHNGHLYAFGGQSGEFLTCVDAATGQVKWTERIYRGQLTLAGGTLVVLSESSGLLRLVAAEPTGYRELSKIQVLSPGARTATPPSIAGGRVFVRNLEELVAVRY